MIRPDLSAMITTFKRIQEPEDYYSGIEYLSPFEVRSLASILLSLRGDLNYLGLYPVAYAMERRYIGVDLSSSAAKTTGDRPETAHYSQPPPSRALRPLTRKPTIADAVL